MVQDLCFAPIVSESVTRTGAQVQHTEPPDRWEITFNMDLDRFSDKRLSGHTVNLKS